MYEAIGLLVPLLGGAVAYLFLRREFGPMKRSGEPPPAYADQTQR